MTLFILSFLAGVLTVLAPCILPLLPVVVGGSLSGDVLSKKRAFIVTGSLGLSVILFTFVLKVSTFFVMVPQEFWQYLSGVIVLVFGVVTLFPKVWEKIPLIGTLNRTSNEVLGQGFQKKSVWGDVIVGASLGPVFSTCSPTYFLVLATVLPRSFALGTFYLLSYALGLSGMMLLVALVGQRIVDRLGFAANPEGWFKKTLGVIFILVGFAVLLGYDKRVETNLLNSGFLDVTKVEQKLLDTHIIKDTLSASTTAQSETKETDVKREAKEKMGKPTLLSFAEKMARFPIAPDISTPDGFINTDGKPITLADFRGKKVVLLDIWTYSCINCQRTIPYLNAWYKKYADKGLMVIGLHTPEFSFEKVQSNVEAAVKQFGIKYPVVLDNDFSTWNAYHNQYWPREYLIDIDGFVVHDHAGEGEYDVTEKAIQDALMERSARLGIDTDFSKEAVNPSDAISVNSADLGSPETYFGSNRNEYLANGISGVSGEQTFSEPSELVPNKLYLLGSWNIKPEYAETSESVGTPTVGSDRIDYLYYAKNFYFVAGTTGTPVEVEVLRDSAPLNTSVKGADIYYRNGKSYVKIEGNRLYTLVEDKTAGKHFLELIISKPGLQAFTFTFG